MQGSFWELQCEFSHIWYTSYCNKPLNHELGADQVIHNLHGWSTRTILVTYDIMEVDGQDVRPEPLEERRKRLTRLLSRSNKALRDGIQLSGAITGDGATIFRHACWMDLEGIVSKRVGSRYVSGRTRAWLKTKTRILSGGDARIFEWAKPELRVIGAGLRTPAARLRIRDLERSKHLGFKLLG